jgi:hypothetical protein
MASAGQKLVDLEIMSEEIRVVVCLVQDCMAVRLVSEDRVSFPQAVCSGSFGGVEQRVLAVLRGLRGNSHFWRWHDCQRDRPK